MVKKLIILLAIIGMLSYPVMADGQMEGPGDSMGDPACGQDRGCQRHANPTEACASEEGKDFGACVSFVMKNK